MNGLTLKQTAAMGSVPLVWQVVGVEDMNGDGRADLVWTVVNGE